MQLSTTKLVLAALSLTLSASADARLISPAAGLNIASVTVFNGTQWAVVTFVSDLSVMQGNSRTCSNVPATIPHPTIPFITLPNDNQAKLNAVVFDISTDGGRASLSLANSAFLSGKRIYVETWDTCPLGLFKVASFTSLR